MLLSEKIIKKLIKKKYIYFSCWIIYWRIINFRDNIFAFDDLDTQILGISLDDVESHKEFSEKYSLPYPILADVEKESAVSYGVLGKFLMMTITKRESFIIDPNGVIVKHYKSVDPEKHTDEVIEELKSIQKRA